MAKPSGFTEFDSVRNLGLFDVLHAGPAEMQSRIDFAQRIYKLKIQSSVVLCSYKLAVGFLSHLDAIDWITAGSQILNLGRGIVRGVIEHRHWKHHRQAICQATTEDEIKARLFSVIVAVDLTMPGIRRRNIDGRLAVSIGRVTYRVVKPFMAIA